MNGFLNAANAFMPAATKRATAGSGKLLDGQFRLD